MSLLKELISLTIKEGFSNPIHSFDKYFYIQIRKINQILELNKKLQLALDQIQSDEDDSWELDRISYKVLDIDSVSLSKVNLEPLHRLKDLMENVLKYRNEGFLKYLFDYLKISQNEYGDLRTSKRITEKSTEGLSDPDLYYGIEPNKADVFKNVINGFWNIHKAILELHISLENRLKEDDRWKKYTSKYNSYSGQMPEEAEDVETLYHTSINAHMIAKTGFIEGFKRDGSMGLGGAGHDQGLVSFTHDLQAARNIARTFKDIIYIAHGELKAPQIIEWFKTEGLEEQLKNFAQEHKDFDRNNPHHVFLLYNTYLWHSKTRENPLFMNTDKSLIDNFKMKQIDDVGIVVAKVNVRHPKAQYIKAEQEIRVPVEAILSIEKVI